MRPPIAARERLLGLLLVTHPLPSSMYVVATAAFSWLAAGAAHRTLDSVKVVLVLVGVACAQIAIGATNDYRDRASDALSRPEKPIARGWIAPRETAALAIVASAVVFATMAPLGPAALVLGFLIEGLGLAYDFGLKGTPWSALLFAIYFPLIPLLAWTVFGRWQPFLPWLLPLGAILGVAMNIANSLPDLEADSAAGVRGLPHLLGLRRGIIASWSLPLLALLIVWILAAADAVPTHPPAMAAATVATATTVGGAILLYSRNPAASTLRLTFIIQALGCVVFAAAWLAGVAF